MRQINGVADGRKMGMFVSEEEASIVVTDREGGVLVSVSVSQGFGVWLDPEQAERIAALMRGAAERARREDDGG